LLFVAFGNPKQEIWIHNNFQKLDIGGAMAVGGAFRYVAGTSSLPPKWMERGGLEWVWRLVTEPARISRIFRAFPMFPLRIFWSRIFED
jgi:N-acetylglucosaminyldiphosphoundecaprenol N-acetyl-beta-D-mannosaminyltransferase